MFIDAKVRQPTVPDRPLSIFLRSSSLPHLGGLVSYTRWSQIAGSCSPGSRQMVVGVLDWVLDWVLDYVLDCLLY